MNKAQIFQVDSTGKKTQLSESQVVAIRKEIYNAFVSWRNAHNGFELLQDETKLVYEEQVPNDIVSAVRTYKKAIEGMKMELLLKMSFSARGSKEHVLNLIEALEYLIDISDAFYKVDGEGIVFIDIYAKIIQPLEAIYNSGDETTMKLKKVWEELKKRNQISDEGMSRTFNKQLWVTPHLESTRDSIDAIVKNVKKSPEDIIIMEKWNDISALINKKNTPWMAKFQEIFDGDKKPSESDLQEFARCIIWLFETEPHRYMREIIDSGEYSNKEVEWIKEAFWLVWSIVWRTIDTKPFFVAYFTGEAKELQKIAQTYT